LPIYWPISRRAAGRFFLARAGIRGGGFSLRFNFSPKARCALRLGVGPRAFGFSISLWYFLLLLLLLLQIENKKALLQSIDCLARLTGATAFLG